MPTTPIDPRHAWPARTYEIRASLPDGSEKTLLRQTPYEKSYPDALDAAVALGRYHGHSKVTLDWGGDITELVIDPALLSPPMKKYEIAVEGVELPVATSQTIDHGPDAGVQEIESVPWKFGR